MSRLLKPGLAVLAALTAAGCASTRPEPPALLAQPPVVDSRLRPPPAAAPAPFTPRPTPFDQLGAEAKAAVFADMSLDVIGERLTQHAARCWRGPGAPFANLAYDEWGLIGRDASGAEVFRARYALVPGTTHGLVAFSGPAFTEALELEAADAVSGRSLCAGEIPAAPPPPVG